MKMQSKGLKEFPQLLSSSSIDPSYNWISFASSRFGALKENKKCKFQVLNLRTLNNPTNGL